jgi:hypothetical protein
MHRNTKASYNSTVVCGAEAPGALFNLDLMLKDDLGTTSDLLYQAVQGLYVATQAITKAAAPGVPNHDDKFEPLADERYEAVTIAADALAVAQGECSDALKAVRRLASVVEFVATLTATHLGVEHSDAGACAAEGTSGE